MKVWHVIRRAQNSPTRKSGGPMPLKRSYAQKRRREREREKKWVTYTTRVSVLRRYFPTDCFAMASAAANWLKLRALAVYRHYNEWENFFSFFLGDAWCALFLHQIILLLLHSALYTCELQNLLRLWYVGPVPTSHGLPRERTNNIPGAFCCTGPAKVSNGSNNSVVRSFLPRFTVNPDNISKIKEEKTKLALSLLRPVKNRFPFWLSLSLCLSFLF